MYGDINYEVGQIYKKISYIIRYFLISVAYFCICIQYFVGWHFEGCEVVFRYASAICILLSFDYSRCNKYIILLLFFLLIALAIRRLLIVWTLFAFVYQTHVFRISIIRLSRVALVILLIVLFFQIDGLLLGLLKNEAITYIKSTQPTYDLGTGNANRCAMLFFQIVILTNILYSKRSSIKYICLSIIFYLLSFYITGSRTVFISSIIIISLTLCYWLDLYRSWMKYVIGFMPILMFVTTFVLSYFFVENKEFAILVSGRLNYIIQFTQDFSFKEWLIGAPRVIDEPLDSAYLEIVHTGGFLLASFLSIKFFISFKKNYNNLIKYIPIIIGMLVAGLTESILLRPSNISVLFWIIIFRSSLDPKQIFK